MIQDICCGFIHEGGPRCCWKWISRKANGSELGRLEHMRTASHRPNTCGHQFERKGVALNAVRCSLVRKAVLKVGSPYYRLYIYEKLLFFPRIRAFSRKRFFARPNSLINIYRGSRIASREQLPFFKGRSLILHKMIPQETYLLMT